jgi:2-(3-amino-3-carboxypropyl)histidine synthase
MIPTPRSLLESDTTTGKCETARSDAVGAARKSIGDIAHKCFSCGYLTGETPTWGVVLGTLGRQGNFRQLQVRGF